MAEWYYSQDGNQMGPVSLEAILKAAKNGLIKPNDMVWKDGWPDWKKASKAPELAAALKGETKPAAVKPAAPAAYAPPDHIDFDIAEPEPEYVAEPVANIPAYAAPAARSVGTMPYRSATQKTKGWNFGDFMNFRFMLAVPFIKAIFIIGIILIVGWALVMLITSIIATSGPRGSIGVAALGIFFAVFGTVLGIIFWRLYCEVFIVIFRINETLTEIKQELQRRN